MYISGIPEGLADGSRLTIAGQELAQSLALTLNDVITVAGVDNVPCVYSRTNAKLYSLEGVNVPRVFGHLSRRRPRR
jgi:hypothetical protein